MYSRVTSLIIVALSFNIIAWRIPGAGEPGGLPSMPSHRVGHDWSDLAVSKASMPLLMYIFKYVFLFSYSSRLTLEYICKF